MKEDELTKKDAEKVMQMFLRKSGFKRWTPLVIEDGKRSRAMLLKDCESHFVLISAWNHERCFARDVVFKGSSCLDVVRRCLEMSRRGLEIYVSDSAGCELVVLMKPFQDLEELLIEADLSCMS